MKPHRIREPGFIFHVTARGNNKQDIFQTDNDKMDYLARAADVFSSYKIRIFAYCLMTNHFHFLLQDTRGGGLPLAMQRLQGGYAQAWNRRYHRSGHVYGAPYDPEPVESDEHLIYGTCYIHVNPLEAGMVGRPQDYRWSSARAYLGGKSDLPVSTDLVLELCGGRANYAGLMKKSGKEFLTGDEHLPDAAKVRELWTAGSAKFRDRIESIVERRVERRKIHRRPVDTDMDGIWKEVFKQTGITRKEIAAPGRARRVSAARGCFCALARQEGIPAADIAQELRITLSAVVHASKKFNRKVLIRV